MNPVAIFAATRWELLALHRSLPTNRSTTVGGVRCLVGSRHGQPYWLVQTGMGPEATGEVAATVFDHQAVGLAISAGFACALTRAAIGDLIVGEEVVSVRMTTRWMVQEGSVRCDPVMTSRALSAARRANVAVTSGTIVSAPAVVWRADDKRELSRLSGGVGLDMESAALGFEAARRGVPFMIARTVSDLVDEDLPMDFNLFLRPAGWAQGARAVLAHPSSLLGLNRLRKQSRVAADQLKNVFSLWAAEGFGFLNAR